MGRLESLDSQDPKETLEQQVFQDQWALRESQDNLDRPELLVKLVRLDSRDLQDLLDSKDLLDKQDHKELKGHLEW